MKALLIMAFGLVSILASGQTDTIQTLTYDSTGRDYVFQFPADDGTSYEKIIMEYSMRCKNGLVSTQGAPNDVGCGEWDYSCNTFIQDSSKTDSIKASHPSYVISNFLGTDYSYTTLPTYTYYNYNQYNMVYNSVVSETEASVGTGTENLDYPFNSASKVSKSQYLWTATELTSAGLSTGNITGLKLNITSANGNANFLRIRMKQTSKTELNNIKPDFNDFTEVYFKNTSMAAGENQFNFYNNFTWDGTSNIIVEYSFTNSTTETTTTVEGHDAGTNMALVNDGSDKFLEFSASGRVDITNSDYSSIENAISVVFWVYGNPNVLPVNTSAFEANDEQGRRQVHAHLPWSNSGIYWDCGNVGGYDRIDKSASFDEIAGQWHHWAFIKDASVGLMRIFLDGETWKTGSGKTKPIDIETFKFGSNVSGNYPYFGYMDEFSIWDKRLEKEDIQDWMYKKVDASHPDYSHLINYFAMDEGSGNIISDNSPNNVSGIHDGMPSWKTHRGIELFKDFATSSFRPNTTFIKGEYSTTLETIVETDSVLNSQNMVIAYQVTGTDLETVDTNYYYRAGNMFVYNESNDIVDTVIVTAEGSLQITDLAYYKKNPSVFEIMSFVTPYGLYLNLGQQGKTWTFDVTDFAPILKGKKRMYLTGGIHQEDLDIKFIFKKGTPARDVVDIQQIWRAGAQRNYNAISTDKYYEPRDVKLNTDASTYKIRTAITGHGQEGEFIKRMHYINLDGGDKEFQWQVWKTCGNNPIYPQGGTWIYDRAGWCPGAPTNLREDEITSYVTAGGTVNIDYGINSASGDSRYLINCQLVSYSNPNFSADVQLYDISRPSDRIEYGRVNPVCYHPTVTIKNTGNANLTSCKITYGVAGGTTKEYDWTGSLEFDKNETVALPIQESSFWIGDDSNVFTATVSNPNGSADEYEGNNTQNSNFVLPDMYDDVLCLNLITNNYAYQNSYEIKDHQGNVVFSKTGLSNNTNYKDTLNLPNGCYTLEMDDTGGDGLSFWANSAQGSGALHLKSATSSTIYKTFQPDFGNGFSYSFVLGEVTYINDAGAYVPKIKVYPNPTADIVNINVSLNGQADVDVCIYDLTGRKVADKLFNNTCTLKTSFDLSGKKNGIYLCEIRTGDKVYIKKISLLKN